jgi:glycosyltransferase involved in cell wall biosynthesis
VGRDRHAPGRGARFGVTRVRVLIAAPWGERAGGAEQMLWTLLRHLNRETIEPELVFLSPGPFADEVSSLGIRTWTIPAGRLRAPIAYTGAVAALVRLIRDRRPELVLAWSAKAHLYLGAANIFTRPRRPALWWQHAIPTGHWLDRLATLVPATAVGCSSHACEAAQLRLRPRRRTFVVHPGVELRRSGSAVSRATLEIPEDAWVVGSVGRLQPWKGHDRVIAAVAELRRRGIPAVALIVGGESFGFSRGYGEELHTLAIEAGIGAHVVFTGHVTEVADYYDLMDVFVNATDSEPFGIALAEAMASGRPVVALSRGGPAEIIEDRISGRLITEADLPVTLSELAADEGLAWRLGTAAADRARSFSPARTVAEFEQALGTAAGPRGTNWRQP